MSERLDSPAVGGCGDGLCVAEDLGGKGSGFRWAGVGAADRLDSVGRRDWISSKADSVMTPFSRRVSSSWGIISMCVCWMR